MGEKAVQVAKETLDKLDFRIPKKRVRINLDKLIRDNHPEKRILQAACVQDSLRIEELQSMVFALASAFKATLQQGGPKHG